MCKHGDAGAGAGAAGGVPVAALTQFLAALRTRDFTGAKLLAFRILTDEPDNPVVLRCLPEIDRYLAAEEAEEEGEEESGSDDESDDDDSDESDDDESDTEEEGEAGGEEGAGQAGASGANAGGAACARAPAPVNAARRVPPPPAADSAVAPLAAAAVAPADSPSDAELNRSLRRLVLTLEGSFPEDAVQSQKK